MIDKALWFTHLYRMIDRALWGDRLHIWDTLLRTQSSPENCNSCLFLKQVLVISHDIIFLGIQENRINWNVVNVICNWKLIGCYYLELEAHWLSLLRPDGFYFRTCLGNRCVCNPAQGIGSPTGARTSLNTKSHHHIITDRVRSTTGR